MKVLGLDISTKAGWALHEDGAPIRFGSVKLDQTVHEFGKYPWNYLTAADRMAEALFQLVRDEQPDVVVVEETNLGKSRYAQKTLEFIHLCLLSEIAMHFEEELANERLKVIYLSSSEWRRALGLVMSKEDKKNNAKLSKAKQLSAEVGAKLDKKALGVKGKVTKKHLALRYVNEKHGLDLRVRDNDAADAICLVDAYLRGATPCDGVMG